MRGPVGSSPSGPLRSASQRLERSSISSGKDNDKELFCSKRGKFRRLIQRSKRASWKDFVISPTCYKDMASLCRTITITNTKSLGLLKGSNGKVLETPKETLALLMNTFFPGAHVAKTKSIPKTKQQPARLQLLTLCGNRDSECC